MPLDARFREVLKSEEELRELLGEPSELAIRKQLSALDAYSRRVIDRSPFVLVATANRAGTCDVSPRGDAPGFVMVLDDRTLIIPERPGNRRADSLKNLLDNPRIGLLFLIPGMEETLRVNGRAAIVRDEELLTRATVRGKRPLLAIAVHVEECFTHCAKAFKRSGLWDTSTWGDSADLQGELMAMRAKVTGKSIEEVQREVEESYRTRLY